MKLVCLSVAFLVGNPGRAETDNVKSSAKKAIFDTYRYEPEVRRKSLEPASPSPVQETESASDVLRLPKLEVRGPELARGLPNAMANARSLAPRNTTKWGTGVREKDFGKIRASATTIFYIPIRAGISW